MEPGNIGGPWSANIDSARFDLRNIRAIGDAAPGDERTTIGELNVEIDGSPEERCFSAAPPGVYSHITLKLSKVAAEGDLEVGGQRDDFDIEDPEDMLLQVNLGGIVVESDTILLIGIDLEVALNTVDWSDVPLDDGERELENGDELDAFRTAMEAGFTLEGTESED